MRTGKAMRPFPPVLGGGSIQLARILGIRIGVDYSWFLVLFLGVLWLNDVFGDVLADTAIGMVIGGPDEFLESATLEEGIAAGVAQLVVSFLVSMNLILLVFNLVPAFPLDGGRIARAAAWKLTGDRDKATRISAYLGQAFAALLIGYGVWQLVGNDNSFGGLWAIVLGYLLG